ncbi:MAG TPA: 23S rRNA (pseudouridine(1915)-N(3))-methyltransferase RlmH [Bacilli bacterium]|nr:23S rRNA (pseudouridine(1915)-N(3))-methyltransferase RlmH [Bacilli bacterium]
MNIEIIAVGKLKESYLVDGIKEYSKRLSAFCNLNIYESKEITQYDILKNMTLEGELIMKKIKDDDFVVTLEIEGTPLSSLDFSNFLSQKKTYGISNLTFIIGGSNGLSQEIKQRSNYHLSFGKITYPHQLMRLILLEQIYRAFMIAANRDYHK